MAGDDDVNGPEISFPEDVDRDMTPSHYVSEFLLEVFLSAKSDTVVPSGKDVKGHNILIGVPTRLVHLL